MRALIPLLLVVAALSTAPAAHASPPACQDRNGQSLGCGKPGAMPFGWVPSTQDLVSRKVMEPPDPTSADLTGIACLIGGLMALIALMPDFQGAAASGWDRGEDEED